MQSSKAESEIDFDRIKEKNHSTHHGRMTMKRYPHTTPWAPAIGFAAAVATVATMALAVVLPAHVQPAADLNAVAKAAGEVTVTLERIEVVASRPTDRSLVPAGFAQTKQRG
jgi:hypothetical protein